MAKSARPDRKQGDRRKREPKEYEETTLSVDRVTRVVAGGRRLRFRAVVIVGNKRGKVGLGTGKANEVQAAVQKATAVAKRNMIRIPLQNGTIPHEVDLKFKASRIRMLPAAEGTGIIAGSALRIVFEHAGIKNILSKRYGTANKLVNAQAVIKALSKLRGELPDDIDQPLGMEHQKEEPGRGRGRDRRDDKKKGGRSHVSDDKDAAVSKTVDKDKESLEEEEELPDGLQVMEVSSADISEEGTVKGGDDKDEVKEKVKDKVEEEVKDDEKDGEDGKDGSSSAEASDDKEEKEEEKKEE